MAQVAGQQGRYLARLFVSHKPKPGKALPAEAPPFRYIDGDPSSAVIDTAVIANCSLCSCFKPSVAPKPSDTEMTTLSNAITFGSRTCSFISLSKQVGRGEGQFG